MGENNHGGGAEEREIRRFEIRKAQTDKISLTYRRARTRIPPLIRHYTQTTDDDPWLCVSNLSVVLTVVSLELPIL